MRRALLALLVLTLATPALAGPAAKVVAKPKPVAMASQAPTQSYVLPPLVPLAASRPGGDAGQCRASCAKQLYFCGVDGDDGGCGSFYAQCAASCKATWTAPRFR